MEQEYIDNSNGFLDKLVKLQEYIKTDMSNGDTRYVFKQPLELGLRLVHSVTIGDRSWYAWTENTSALEKRAKRDYDHEIYRDNRKVVKPVFELISNLGSAKINFMTGNKINAIELELLLVEAGYWQDLHLRTKGFIRNSFNWVQGSQYSTTSKTGSKFIFDLMRKLNGVPVYE